MTVVHVISGLGVGGAETMLAQVTTALQAGGMAQHVLSLTGDGELGPSLRDRGVSVTDINLCGIRGAPGALLRLTQLIGALRPRLIQGWMYHGNIAAALAHRLASGRAGRRLIWGIRASDVDAARYGAINWLSARLSRWPDMVIANSTAGARFHSKLGYRPRRLEIISNGVDCGRFRPDEELRGAMRMELGIAPDAIVAIHVARVDPMKDHATFLAAIQRIPHVTGLLVGKGTDALALSANVRALGLRGDVKQLYAGADIVVSSSAFGEGFSNVLAEGMASGLIAVATDVGDAAAIVGDTGTIVRPRDADELANAIAAVAGLTKAERHARGAVARARIEAKFTIERAIDAHARLYREAAGETAR